MHKEKLKMVQQPPPSTLAWAHAHCWVSKSYERENEAWVLETEKNEFVSMGEDLYCFLGSMLSILLRGK